MPCWCAHLLYHHPLCSYSNDAINFVLRPSLSFTLVLLARLGCSWSHTTFTPLPQHSSRTHDAACHLSHISFQTTSAFHRHIMVSFRRIQQSRRANQKGSRRRDSRQRFRGPRTRFLLLLVDFLCHFCHSYRYCRHFLARRYQKVDRLVQRGVGGDSCDANDVACSVSHVRTAYSTSSC